jgi:alkylation response protein AidB-like acyl-CoA dehydrogenase
VVGDLSAGSVRKPARTYTIFEGTSEIQRLVIARAISGIHIP